jgi:hypothetical protein
VICSPIAPFHAEGLTLLPAKSYLLLGHGEVIIPSWLALLY